MALELCLIKLSFVASLDNMDEIMKQCGPEVSDLNEFLGGINGLKGGHHKHLYGRHLQLSQ